MKIFSTTDARIHLSKIVNDVYYKKVIIGIGRRNACEVVMIPYPDANESDVNITSVNAMSSAFWFLGDEPDEYTIDDLKKRYV